MNSLASYGSDSEGSDAAGPSVSVTKQRTTRAATDDDDDDDVKVDASDAFGLGGIKGKAEVAKTTPKASSVAAGPSTAVVVAPDVGPEDPSLSTALLTRPTDTEMHVNIRYEDMMAPAAGPVNPFASRGLGSKQNNLAGHVEEAAMSEFDFKNQQRTFDTLGYARNPNAPGAFVGDVNLALANQGASALELRGGGNAGRAAARQLKKKRQGQNGDASVVEGDGAYVGPWGGWEGEKVAVPGGVGPTDEEIRIAQEKSTLRKKEAEEMAERRKREEEQGTEKSVFHGKSMYDYQGRTYMHVPTDVDTNLHGEAGEETCFVPKACIHTWTGHTKGVNAVRLFPGSGHLMLSGSMDAKVKLWDVYHEGNCLRTFMGHSKGVRDVNFSADGRRFLSAGFDRQIKLWDTETGQCLRAFSNGKVPYVVKFHPELEHHNCFLAGMGDKKIVQFDLETGEVQQEYDQHLGPVNSITFVDENRRFVTTSDDKSMRAWDFNIPVTVKIVSDPTMNSMPSVTLHPNKKWLACQSLDNQILVYAADSFRQARNKVFKGHQVAGYACEVGFSPDGRFLSTGDSEGNLVFFDWKRGRLLKRIRAHKEVVMSHVWLPHETSKVISGSWDGQIKLWD